MSSHRPGKNPPASMIMLNACIPLFDVLKDPHRQALFMELVMQGSMSVGDLAATSPLDRTTISHHLKALQQAGLVDITKSGTRRLCRPRTTEVLQQLTGLVDALQSDLATIAACRHDPTPQDPKPHDSIKEPDTTSG